MFLQNMFYGVYKFGSLQKTRDTRWHSWLRHYATGRKVAGSIPDGVSGIFSDLILLVALWLWGRLSL
jgi:hypothetical protein